MIIVPIAFSIISRHCITRRELHSTFKMLLMKGDIDNSERPKKQNKCRELLQWWARSKCFSRVGDEAKYTGSSGSTQGREFKRIENPRHRQSKRIRKVEIMISSIIMSQSSGVLYREMFVINQNRWVLWHQPAAATRSHVMLQIATE